MTEDNFMLKHSDTILITGSNGFIGSRVVKGLLDCGFANLRCLVRPSSNIASLEKIVSGYSGANVDIIRGNLQSRDDCRRITEDSSVIYHLAAGRGEKSYPDAYMNTVITTRNLLDGILQTKNFKRLVLVSSFAVYSNWNIPRHGLLDESCEVESSPHLRGEAYCYAKVRQEEIVAAYGRQFNIPHVIVRPGVVYGPGNKGLTGRVGLGTFGVFLHLGGPNIIPLSYVDNCADAIILAGLKKGVDGEIFNIVDDNLPTSREFLRMYKQNVAHFKLIYVPHRISYFLSYLWEKYSVWSQGQLPPTFNRKKWSNYWKGNKYSNKKIKQVLGWEQRIAFSEAARRYFEYQKAEATHI